MTARSSGSSRLKPRSSCVAIRDPRHGVGGRRLSRHLLDMDIEAMAPSPPNLVGAGVDKESIQPGVEAGRVAQRGQIAPCADEGVLDGVHRLVRVPEHEPSGAVETRDRGACQHGEGVMIAPSCSLHEVVAHLAPRRRRGASGRVHEYGEWTCPFGFTLRRGAVRGAGAAADAGYDRGSPRPHPPGGPLVA